jgi:YVTN family beta-propeller protein
MMVLGVLACSAVSSGQVDMISSVAPPGVLFEVLALNRDMPTPLKPKYRSPVEIIPSPDKTKLFICEQTAKRIAIFNLKDEVVEGVIRLPNEVTGCAVTGDGATIYATIGSEWWPTGYVCVVDVASGTVVKRIAVGHYPRSPVLTPDGTKLYVNNMFGNNVSVIDVASNTKIKTIDVVREPYASAMSPDGRILVVGNSLPDDRSTDTTFVSCKVSLIDVATDEVSKEIRLTRGSHSVFGLTVSPDSKYAYATHLIGKFNLIGTTVEKGWLHTNNLAVIDLTAGEFVNDVCLDLSSMGAGNPWGVKCTDDGQFMVIVHAGSNEISFIKMDEFMDSVLIRTARGDDMQQEFTSMLKSRKKIPAKTKGPRALALIGNLAYTAGYFDDVEGRLEEYEISLSTSRASYTFTIGESQAWTGERHGESNYYDADLCFQKWQSCHSCHPLTRPDALNWILGGGAVVAPKNAKSMLYSWWTPPTTWTGRRGHCQQSIVAGIEVELFRAATRDLAGPLDTLFMYMKPMPSPKLEKGRLSAAAQRGKAIFYNEDKVDCIVCHPPPLFTDNLFWNTGVPDPFDANTQWVTPHLAECWRTGPYGHLGSYWGIREILELESHSNAYQNLTVEEMDDLVAYIEAL